MSGWDHLIDAVHDNEGEEWKAAAWDFLCVLSSAGRPFTTDDVMDNMAETGIPCRDARALGGLVRRATRQGLMYQVGMTSSRRRHGSLIRQYVGPIPAEVTA